MAGLRFGIENEKTESGVVKAGLGGGRLGLRCLRVRVRGGACRRGVWRRGECGYG